MTTKKKTDETVSPAVSIFNAMQDAGMNSFPAFGMSWIEAMTNMSAEMAKFMADRVQQDVKTRQDILQTKGITDVQRIQAEFFQKAMDDYSAEMTKLVEMGKGLAPTTTPGKDTKAGS